MTDFWPVDYAASVSEARRRLLDTEYDLVLINAPLPDDFGARLATGLCADTGAGVLLFVKAAQYEEVCAKVLEQGVMTIPKPAPAQVVRQSLRVLCATRERLRRMEETPGLGGGEDRRDTPREPGQVAAHRATGHDRGRGAPLYRKAIHGPAHPTAGAGRKHYKDLRMSGRRGQ